MDLTLKRKDDVAINDNSVSHYYIPKISSLILNMIYSLALFSGMIYGTVLLYNYLQTNEKFSIYFDKGLGIYETINALVYSIIADNKISRALSLLIKNFNAEVFSHITTVLVLISTIAFIAVLFITFIYNLGYIIYTKKLKSILKMDIPNFLDEDGNIYNPLESRLNSSIKKINVIYSVITYISILITESAVVFTSIIAGTAVVTGFLDQEDNWESIVKICRIIIIIGFVILFFIGTFLIVKKGERIANTPNYVYYENLTTYLKGIVISLIPLLSIAAIALFFLLFIVYLLVSGARSSND